MNLCKVAGVEGISGTLRIANRHDLVLCSSNYAQPVLRIMDHWFGVVSSFKIIG